MPLLNIETNCPVSPDLEKTLLADLSKLAAQQLGKPEAYVMVRINAGNTMLFAGSDQPLAYVEVKSIGLQTSQAPGLSRTVCNFLKDRLGIDPSRVYIEFASAPGPMWGWNGETF